MATLPLARHLLRARDFVDARYAEPLTVSELAATAALSPAYFSREFKRPQERAGRANGGRFPPLTCSGDWITASGRA
jgi:hypothetical protein